MKKILQFLSLKASRITGLFKYSKKKSWKYFVLAFFLLLIILIPLATVFAAEGGDKVLNAILAPINGILFAILSLLGNILILIIDLMLKIVSYNNFVHEGFVIKGWIVMRDVLNTLFIFFLLLIAFATIFNYESYGYKSLLGKVLLAAILVNFSRTIAGIAIDISHVFMMIFLNAFKDAAAGNFTSGLGIRDIVKFGTSEPGDITGKAIFGSLIFGIVYILIAVVTVLVYFLMFVLRIIALWFLVITSPIYFVLNAVPFGKQSASQWLKNFSKYLVIGPALAFFLWLSLAAMGTVSQTFHSQVSNVDTEAQVQGGDDQLSVAVSKSAQPAGMMSYVISIGLLWGSLIYASKSGVAGSQVAGKAMDKMKKIGSSTVKKAGLAPFKHVGGRIARSEGIKKAFDAVGGRGGKLGTALMLTGLRPAAEKLGLKMQDNKDKYKKEAEKKVKALQGADMDASLRRRAQQSGRWASPFRVPSQAVRDEIHKKHPEYLEAKDAAKWVGKNRTAKALNGVKAPAMLAVRETLLEDAASGSDTAADSQVAINELDQSIQLKGVRADIKAANNRDNNGNIIPWAGQQGKLNQIFGIAKAPDATDYYAAAGTDPEDVDQRREYHDGKYHTANDTNLEEAQDRYLAAEEEGADEPEPDTEKEELQDQRDEEQYGERAGVLTVDQKKKDATRDAEAAYEQSVTGRKAQIAESLGKSLEEYQTELDTKGPHKIIQEAKKKGFKAKDVLVSSFFESDEYKEDFKKPAEQRKYVSYEQTQQRSRQQQGGTQTKEPTVPVVAEATGPAPLGINQFLRATQEAKLNKDAGIDPALDLDFKQHGIQGVNGQATIQGKKLDALKKSILAQATSQGIPENQLAQLGETLDKSEELKVKDSALARLGGSRVTGVERMLRSDIRGEKLESGHISADFGQLGLQEGGGFFTANKAEIEKIKNKVLQQMLKEGYDQSEIDAASRQFSGMKSLRMLNKAYEPYQQQEAATKIDGKPVTQGFRRLKHTVAEEMMHEQMESVSPENKQKLWAMVPEEEQGAIKDTVYKGWDIAESDKEKPETDDLVMNEYLTNALVNRNKAWNLPGLKFDLPDDSPILQEINSNNDYAPIRNIFEKIQADGAADSRDTDVPIQHTFATAAGGEAIRQEFGESAQIISQPAPVVGQDSGALEEIADTLSDISAGVSGVQSGLADTADAFQEGAQATERGVGELAEEMRKADTDEQTREATQIARERRYRREDSAEAKKQTEEVKEGLRGVSEQVEDNQESSEKEGETPVPASEPSVPQPPSEEV